MKRTSPGKTTDDLRDILSEEIDKLRVGKTTTSNVQAIVNATGKFLSTAKVEMEYAKMIGKKPNFTFIKLSDKPL